MPLQLTCRVQAAACDVCFGPTTAVCRPTPLTGQHRSLRMISSTFVLQVNGVERIFIYSPIEPPSCTSLIGISTSATTFTFDHGYALSTLSNIEFAKPTASVSDSDIMRCHGSGTLGSQLLKLKACDVSRRTVMSLPDLPKY